MIRYLHEVTIIEAKLLAGGGLRLG